MPLWLTLQSCFNISGNVVRIASGPMASIREISLYSLPAFMSHKFRTDGGISQKVVAVADHQVHLLQPNGDMPWPVFSQGFSSDAKITYKLKTSFEEDKIAESPNTVV